ncbi:gliding motility-associated C-terminal domain-containing protein [Fulvivirga sp. M361]|uniref:T9SS type B sorting domain-containing protein n=1 Tax=Fulvivirga sp. M361 TaxID=2594266 RepID=UPI0016298C39|nr:gliding motility-associated C-terminal domain-containing protein [Fulvivirga sp. M361]
MLRIRKSYCVIWVNNNTFFSSSKIDYSWDFGNNDSSIEVNPDYAYSESGVYQITLTATTDKNCSDAISRTISVVNFQGVSAGNDQTIDNGSSVQLSASGGQSYSWTPTEDLTNPFAANPIATPSTTTMYVVEGTNFLGCTHQDSVTIFVNENFNININNVLTPNGDGVNDNWEIDNLESINNPSVQVFDRNGVEVFSSNGYNNDWQGTRGSDILPDGTYYYIVVSESSNAIFRGALTIIRDGKK